VTADAEPPSLVTCLGWVRDGGRRFGAAVDALAEVDLQMPSRLPGWSRAHVVSHVACNAEALANLVHWARTGIETPMYDSDAQRVADIDRAAHEPLAVLRAVFDDRDAKLIEAFDTLDGTAWDATVRTALGRRIPAREIPWLRARELWIHAVDLGTGFALDDLPVDLTHALISDVVRWRSGHDDCLDVVLRPDHDGSEWRMGAGRGDPSVVSGPLGEVLAWLLGRGIGDGLRAPDAAVDLPRWL
jgi:maleylpyruvate isomerase